MIVSFRVVVVVAAAATDQQRWVEDLAALSKSAHQGDCLLTAAAADAGHPSPSSAQLTRSLQPATLSIGLRVTVDYHSDG